MRDGIQLNATIYHPAPAGTAKPALISMTPYSGDTYHEQASYFARRGFVFVLVDVRGRGSSGGEFEPFANEARDGHDIVNWVATQPWCDGNVGMWGGSYAGMAQWFTASTSPANLRTIAPAGPSIMGEDVPFRRGIYLSYWIQWLTLTSGKTTQWQAFRDSAYWFEIFKRGYLEHRAFGELDRLARNTQTVWQTWIAHPFLDDYWQSINPDREDYARITIPVLSISGLYDGALHSTLEYYRRHLAGAGADRHYLVIGPWDHAGTRLPAPALGGLSFGPLALLNVNALHAAWYDWTFGNGDKPSFLKDQVVYYVTGLEEWRSAPTVDAVTTSRSKLFLHSRNGQAHDVFASGELTPHDALSSKPATYTYDPLDTRPAEFLQPQDLVSPITLFDQTAALNLFGNGLVYHSEPLETDVVLGGAPIVHLWISIDVPDTDIRVALYQIMPDGSSLVLGEDKMRTRYRISPRHAKFPTPGKPYEYVFDGMPFNSRLVVRHSRFRVVVTCPNSMFEQKNYNSGGDVLWETAKDARTAHVSVHHGTPHSSYVDLALGNLGAATQLNTTDLAGWFSLG